MNSMALVVSLIELIDIDIVYASYGTGVGVGSPNAAYKPI